MLMWVGDGYVIDGYYKNIEMIRIWDRSSYAKERQIPPYKLEYLLPSSILEDAPEHPTFETIEEAKDFAEKEMDRWLDEAGLMVRSDN